MPSASHHRPASCANECKLTKHCAIHFPHTRAPSFHWIINTAFPPAPPARPTTLTKKSRARVCARKHIPECARAETQQHNGAFYEKRVFRGREMRDGCMVHRHCGTKRSVNILTQTPTHGTSQHTHTHTRIHSVTHNNKHRMSICAPQTHVCESFVTRLRTVHTWHIKDVCTICAMCGGNTTYYTHYIHSQHSRNGRGESAHIAPAEFCLYYGRTSSCAVNRQRSISRAGVFRFFVEPRFGRRHRRAQCVLRCRMLSYIVIEE